MASTLVIQPGARRDVGDDAVLDVLIRALGVDQIVVATSEPAHVQARLGCRAVPATVPAVLREIRTAGALVVFGGTAISPARAGHDDSAPAPGLSVHQITALVIAAKLRGLVTALAGVGVVADGRWPQSSFTDQRVLRLLARQVHLLVLRDDASAAALASIGVPEPLRVGTDPAWAGIRVENDRPAHPGAAEQMVAVLSSGDIAAAGGPPAAADVVAAVTRAVGRSRVQPDHLRNRPQQEQQTGGAAVHVELVAWHVGSTSARDEQALAAVAHELSDRHHVSARVRPAPRTLTEAQRLAAASALVLSGRLHAVVVAASTSCPCVVWPPQPAAAAAGAALGLPVAGTAATPAQVALCAEAALAATPRLTDAERDLTRRGAEMLALVQLVVSRGIEVPTRHQLPSGGGLRVLSKETTP